MRIDVYLLFGAVAATALARQPPTSFCKCICFQNSTIIPLNAPPSSSSTSAGSIPTSTAHLFRSRTDSIDLNHFPRDDDDSKDDNSDDNNNQDDSDDGTATHRKASHKHRSLTCNDCNRAFCLDYNLPICKNAKEEDVFTMCFQRDSVKDESVVLLFILLTTSLLAWALLKPFVTKFRNGGGGQGMVRYAPVGLGSGAGAGGRGRGRGGIGFQGESGHLPTSNRDFANVDDLNHTSETSRPRAGRTSTINSLARQGGLNS